MTEPTDTEIIAFAAAAGVRIRTGTAAVRFARAVLAKWGQPAHSGESFQTYGETRAYSKGYYAGKKAALVSQPAHSGEPLTVSQIRDWWASENGLEDCEMCKPTDFLRVVRAVEEKHGIKGGQHGADT